MVEINDKFYMDILLNYTWKSQCLALPNPSVGAMVLDNNQSILSISIHNNYGDAHAELNAAKLAYIKLSNNNTIENITNPTDIYSFLIEKHNNLFRKTTFFITLEPCSHFGKTPSCAVLLSILRPKRVVICAREKNNIAKNGIDIIKKADIEVESGVYENRGEDLLFPFLSLKEKSSFSIYKVAKRLNGSFTNGTISSIESRIYSHKLRNIASKIIISQKTILADNPILDSRFCNGKAPDVSIIGRENKLFNELNIFSIKNRNINFYNKIEDIDFSGFNIIEGGSTLFNNIKNHIDCMLIFIAPQMINNINFSAEFNGRILYGTQIGEDILLWIKKD